MLEVLDLPETEVFADDTSERDLSLGAFDDTDLLFTEDFDDDAAECRAGRCQAPDRTEVEDLDIDT